MFRLGYLMGWWFLSDWMTWQWRRRNDQWGTLQKSSPTLVHLSFTSHSYMPVMSFIYCILSSEPRRGESAKIHPIIHRWIQKCSGDERERGRRIFGGYWFGNPCDAAAVEGVSRQHERGNGGLRQTTDCLGKEEEVRKRNGTDSIKSQYSGKQG